MRVRTTSHGIVIGAPAKVNLFLELLGKRADGYHELATLMVGLSLRDTLAFSECADGNVTLTSNWPELSIGEDNLIVKAARQFRAKTQIQRGVRIRVAKRIPMAAGLAGGSTDAAATLLGLNRLWNAELSLRELAEMAGELGSDIAFFLSLPAAWCTSRGEIVQPLVARRGFNLVLIFPPFGCNTASVYRHTSPPAETISGRGLCEAFVAGDVDALGHALHNRLEPAAEIVAPGLRKLRDAADRIAPFGCRMSGSGSTLFALAHDRAEALGIVKRLQALPELAGCGVRAVRTLKSSVR